MQSIVIIVILIGVLAGLIYQGQTPKLTNNRERLFVDRLAKWLTSQVALQCDVSADNLKKRAKNRIYGAACKAFKPLSQNEEVQIKLPDIVIDKHKKPKTFSITISMKELAHLRQDNS